MTSHTSNDRSNGALRARRRLVIMAVAAAVVLCLLVGAAVVVTSARPHSEPKPTTVPTLPTTEPTQPSTEITEPSTEITEPSTEPTVPAEPLILPPTVELNLGSYLVGMDLTTELLVSGLEGTGITASLERPVQVAAGWQNVTLIFTDGTRACSRQTTVYGFTMETSATVFAEDAHVPTVSDFIRDSNVTATFLNAADQPLTVSSQVAMTIVCQGVEYPVTYLVGERQSPVGVPQQVTTQSGILPDPATLLAQIQDDSAVTVTYLETPDLSVVGQVEAKLLLTDAWGNTATVIATITVIPNENAPQFTGLDKISVSLGQTISYKGGVAATDLQDGNVSFQVDNSAVDTSMPGTYTVYYTATDSDGNTTIMPRTVVIRGITEDVVYRYAQNVLDKIITPDMTRDQMIRRIQKYTYDAVAYVGTSDKSSVINGAYEGFTTGQGDCYTYYAMNVVFFDLLGIESLEVTRINGTTHHWWNLVLYEDGYYYHLDSCHAKFKPEGFDFAKMTDSDLEWYTTHPNVISRRPNYYTYDKTLPEYEGINIAP